MICNFQNEVETQRRKASSENFAICERVERCVDLRWDGKLGDSEDKTCVALHWNSSENEYSMILHCCCPFVIVTRTTKIMTKTLECNVPLKSNITIKLDSFINGMKIVETLLF